MKKFLLSLIAVAVGLCLLVAGTAGYYLAGAAAAKERAVIQLKKEVARDLHDPEAVRFRDVTLYSYADHLGSFRSLFAHIAQDSKKNLQILLRNPNQVLTYKLEDFALCGQLNAKNRLGAYVGYSDFYIRSADAAKPLVLVEGLGCDKAFIEKMCSSGVPVMKAPDTGNST